MCAYCILNENAACLPFIGTEQTGMARDLLGERVQISPQRSLVWVIGAPIPPGSEWLIDIFQFFGPDVDLRWPSTRERVWPYAVTMRAGTMMCAPCNARGLR